MQIIQFSKRKTFFFSSNPTLASIRTFHGMPAYRIVGFRVICCRLPDYLFQRNNLCLQRKKGMNCFTRICFYIVNFRLTCTKLGSLEIGPWDVCGAEEMLEHFVLICHKFCHCGALVEEWIRPFERATHVVHHRSRARSHSRAFRALGYMRDALPHALTLRNQSRDLVHKTSLILSAIQTIHEHKDSD